MVVTGVTPSGPAENGRPETGRHHPLRWRTRKCRRDPSSTGKSGRNGRGTLITFHVIRGDGSVDVRVPSRDRWDFNQPTPPAGKADN